MAIRKEKEEIAEDSLRELSTLQKTESGSLRRAKLSCMTSTLNGSRRPGKWASDVLMAGITAKASRHWRPS